MFFTLQYTVHTLKSSCFPYLKYIRKCCKFISSFFPHLYSEQKVSSRIFDHGICRRLPLGALKSGTWNLRELPRLALDVVKINFLQGPLGAL